MDMVKSESKYDKALEVKFKKKYVLKALKIFKPERFDSEAERVTTIGALVGVSMDTVYRWRKGEKDESENILY